MNEPTRIDSLDLGRGLSLMAILLFHGAIYNFANIHLLDFSNPPLVVVLISFLGLWGGIFILYSMAINTWMLAGRSSPGNLIPQLKFLLLAGALYLLLHFVLNLALGRWHIDFENNRPSLPLAASLIRSGRLEPPPTSLWFDGSSLSTIALNLILLSGLSYALLKSGGIRKDLRNYLVLGGSGTAILLLSFTRIGLFPLYEKAVAEGPVIRGVLLSFLLANPYPLLPYLAYGLFGILLGLMLYKNQRQLMRRVMIPLGLFFLLLGLAGMSRFDKTISVPDYFWYFKTYFELGAFILLFVAFALPKKAGRFTLFIRRFSRVSLTVYLLETSVSELLRAPAAWLAPGWDQTINGSLAFGALQVVVWSIILFFWEKAHFRYSLEYFWVKGLERLGKKSTKMLDV